MMVRKMARLIDRSKMVAVNKFLDIQAILNFMKERKVKRNDSEIRVAFLTQYIPAWNKFEPIYNKLKDDSRFKVYIICVPFGIHNNKLDDAESITNDTYNYFIEQGYDAINSLIGKDKWLDLKELQLDYIFYPRPYNNFMPSVYKSNKVSRYTKICHIIYGMATTKEIIPLTINKGFYRNVYCYFAESVEALEYNKKQLSLSHKMKLQKTVFYGLPVFSQILRCKKQESLSWSFSKNHFRVMWTPRWTTKKSLGGSNFFMYQKFLLKYAMKNENVDFLFRPHPLMFDNFIKTGEMTESEVKQFKDTCNDLNNVSIDLCDEYVATLWNTSVLISDISGIMPEYFITGKPLIYCASNMELELTETAKKMIEGCYVVYNEEELQNCLEKIERGEDELKEKRIEIIDKIFKDAIENAEDNIFNELIKSKNIDYNKNDFRRNEKSFV